MIYVIMFLFFGLLVIVARYRWREEWGIPVEQTKKEVYTGVILLVIIVIMAQAYSDKYEKKKVGHSSNTYQNSQH